MKFLSGTISNEEYLLKKSVIGLDFLFRRKMLKYWAVFIFVLCVSVSGSAWSKDFANRVIVPGMRVGEINIGDAYHPYEKSWGKPDLVTKIPQGYLCKFNKLRMCFLVHQDTIIAIYCGNPFYYTGKNLHVGSKENEIRRAFGDAKRVIRSGKNGYAVHFSNHGISFVVDSNEIIEQIIIY